VSFMDMGVADVCSRSRDGWAGYRCAQGWGA
jgi:hypothetical protein